MRVLSAAEMRACDKQAIDVFGVPGAALMETAGRAVAKRARMLLEEGGGDAALVVCGAGNNGGDGFVAARYLHRAGIDAQVICVCDPDDLRGDAKVFHDVIARIGIAIAYVGGDAIALPPVSVGPGDVIIDALFGTGLSRPVAGRARELIGAMRALRDAGARVVAVDLPSGVHADTGQVLGAAVEADVTVTFGYLKRGLLQHPGRRLTGCWEVVDIGLPEQVEETLGPECSLLDEAEVRSLLLAPADDANKGRLGHVLVVAGSADRPGAAALACLGALRSGAGLVTVASRPGGLVSTRALVPEAMTITLPGEGALELDDLRAIEGALLGKRALLIGPGIPRSEATRPLLKKLLANIEVPVVIDADALNAIGEDRQLFEGVGPEIVLTPHPGEISRLLPSTTAAVQADRFAAATTLATECQTTVVLKGAGTLVVEADGRTAINPTGNAGLATGGTGDVLGGIIAALLARGLPAAQAARAAVFVHGLAADRLLERRGQSGLIAGDLPGALAEIWASWAL